VKVPTTSQTIEVVLGKTLKAVNPCTNAIAIFKLGWVAHVKRIGSRYELDGKGEMSTNDGFAGVVSAQFIINDAAQHLLIESSEATDVEGRALRMRIGLYYEWRDGGAPIVSFEEVTPVGCDE
jgi:hypothetical protein